MFGSDFHSVTRSSLLSHWRCIRMFNSKAFLRLVSISLIFLVCTFTVTPSVNALPPWGWMGIGLVLGWYINCTLGSAEYNECAERADDHYDDCTTMCDNISEGGCHDSLDCTMCCLDKFAIDIADCATQCLCCFFDTYRDDCYNDSRTFAMGCRYDDTYND